MSLDGTTLAAAHQYGRGRRTTLAQPVHRHFLALERPAGHRDEQTHGSLMAVVAYSGSLWTSSGGSWNSATAMATTIWTRRTGRPSRRAPPTATMVAVATVNHDGEGSIYLSTDLAQLNKAVFGGSASLNLVDAAVAARLETRPSPAADRSGSRRTRAPPGRRSCRPGSRRRRQSRWHQGRRPQPARPRGPGARSRAADGARLAAYRERGSIYTSATRRLVDRGRDWPGARNWRRSR